MSEEGIRWSKSQKEAYGFIRRAIEEGYNATNALETYRDGGGHISNEYWYDLYRETKQHNEWVSTIEVIPDTYTIREPVFQDVDWDLRKEYAVMGHVRGYDRETGEYMEKWVTAESDEPLTKTEWENALQQAVYDTIGSPDMEIESVFEWDAVRRM